MLHSGCPENRDILVPPPDLASLKNVVVGKTDGKASINLNDGSIVIDGDYLRSLDSESSVEAVLFHEIAHQQASGCARNCEGKPAGCERCADNRAGACMAMVGYSRKEAQAAFNGMRLNRSTAIQDAMLGFDFAVNNTRNLTPVMTQAPSFGMPGAPSPNTRTAPQIPVTDVFGAPLPEPLPLPMPRPVKPVAPSIPSAPAPSSPSAPSTVVDYSCDYDYGWVVGVFGGLSVVTILVMRWAVKS